MLKRFLFPWLPGPVIVVLLIGLLITGGVVYGRRAPNDYRCLVVVDRFGLPLELFEVNTGLRAAYRRWIPPWNDPSMQRTSPDGKYIASFQPASLRSKRYKLSVQEIATGKITTVLSDLITIRDDVNYHSSHDIIWSPESNRLAFVWNMPPELQFIITLGVDGTDVQRLDNVSVLNGWSMDGNYLAVSVARSSWTPYGPLYLWSLPEAKLTLISQSGYEPSAVAWSPTGNRLAFVERPNGNLPQGTQGPVSLGIVSPGQSASIRFSMQSTGPWINEIPVWSPDSRYVALPYINTQGSMQLRLFDVEKGGVILQAAIDHEITFQLPKLWLNNRVLTFVRRGPTRDWVKYYPGENRYEMVVPNVQQITTEDSPYPGKVIVVYSYDVLRNAEYDILSNIDLIDADGTNRVARIKNANEVSYNEGTMVQPFLSRSRDGKGLAILWTSNEDSQRRSRLTWVIAEGSKPHIFTESFPEQREQFGFTWLEGSKAIAVIAPFLDKPSVRLIRTEDGSQKPLFKTNSPYSVAMTGLIHSKTGRPYSGFVWHDDSDTAWIDVYDSNGQRLYHFQAKFTYAGYISPDGQLAALLVQSMSQQNSFELLFSSADGKWLHTVRAGMKGLRNVKWSPDGKMLAFNQSSPSGVATLEIVNPKGDILRSFDVTHIQGWEDLKWTHCDAHE